MRVKFQTLAALAAAALAAPLGAAVLSGSAEIGKTLPPYLQCVPYARQVSGIQIYGDAHTWWGQAEGKYARGSVPKVGAVMNLRPHGNSRLGHVAAVSKIIDSRTILIRHANWSPINGRRGQIEDNVRAIDVSENNDWSKVRIWYAPIKALGGAEWPLYGFIYNEKPGKAKKPGKMALSDKVEKSGKPERTKLAKEPAAAKAMSGKSRLPATAPMMANDPIGAIIARGGR